MESILAKLAREEHALTAHRLADLLGLKPITIYRLAARGVLPCFRIASTLRFCPATIATYLRAHEIGGAR